MHFSTWIDKHQDNLMMIQQRDLVEFQSQCESSFLPLVHKTSHQQSHDFNQQNKYTSHGAFLRLRFSIPNLLWSFILNDSILNKILKRYDQLPMIALFSGCSTASKALLSPRGFVSRLWLPAIVPYHQTTLLHDMSFEHITRSIAKVNIHVNFVNHNKIIQMFRFSILMQIIRWGEFMHDPMIVNDIRDK